MSPTVKVMNNALTMHRKNKYRSEITFITFTLKIIELYILKL